MDEAGESSKFYYRGENKFAAQLTSSGCNKISTDLTAASFDIQKIITLAEFTSDDTEVILDSITIFEEYDTTKKGEITGNNKSL